MFLPSQEVVQFYFELLHHVLNSSTREDNSDVEDDEDNDEDMYNVFALHGDMKQEVCDSEFFSCFSYDSFLHSLLVIKFSLPPPSVLPMSTYYSPNLSTALSITPSVLQSAPFYYIYLSNHYCIHLYIGLNVSLSVISFSSSPSF